MKTMCPSGCHHNGFVATHALGYMMYGCYKAIVVTTGWYIYIYIYMIVKKCAIIFFSIYLYFIIIHLIINNQGSEIKKKHFFAFRNTLLQKLSSCSFFLYIHQKATFNNAKAFLHILVNFFKQLLIMQKLSFTSW